MTFQQFLLILRARRWIVLGVLLGVSCLTLVVSLILPKQYTAVTSLVIDSKMTDPVLGAMGGMQPGYLATQVDIITSERVAARVVEMSKMDQYASVRQSWKEQTGGQGGDKALRIWLANWLKRNLDVRPSTSSRESNVINVSYTGSDPESAAQVADAFARAYIETNLALKVDPARQYADWFGGQTKDVRDTLEKAQRRLSDYEQEHKVLVGDGRFDFENMRLAELTSQLSAALGQGAEGRARITERGSAESLPEVMGNPVVSSLTTSLAQLEAERSQMLGKLGPNHPQIIEVGERITELRQRRATEIQRVASSLGTNSRISDVRIKELEDAIKDQQDRVLELKKHKDQLAVLQRDVENAQKAYDLVTQRLAQTNLDSQVQQTNISVLTPASPPLEHSSPKVVLNMVVAVFLGILLGIGVALLLELIDQRVRGGEDLEQCIDVPVLGVVPGLKKKKKASSKKVLAVRHPAAA